MIDAYSIFTASIIPVHHNAVKSIIFRCAELLMAVFIYKLFSLIAARSHQFTSYLMFAEDYVQRLLFLSSRGFSRAGLVVFLFTILNLLASLYGTLLWALDAPGYLFKTENSTIAQYLSYRNENPPYVVQLQLDPGNPEEMTSNLIQIAGSGLFNAGLNYTLTGDVDRGSPEIVPQSRTEKVGARIWLDEQGFSVSTDQYVMYPNLDDGRDAVFPDGCIYWGADYGTWNCTFNNTFSQAMLQTLVGRPEVHWDDSSDLELDSRYISPNRIDNIWASYGAGGGSTAMMQVFTVTKGRRRHTFVESVLRATLLTSPNIPFAENEVDDLVRRIWSPTNETERQSPIVGQIISDMISAQSEDMSYYSGASAVSNEGLSVSQSTFGLFKPISGGKGVFSIVVVTATNITLIRSETLEEEVQPYQPCTTLSFQNEAFGGKVKQTDCVATSMSNDTARFFGQVDTAAVLVTYGLGNGRSNISSESLSDDALVWVSEISPVMEELMIARGYAVSVDPGLVKISVQTLVVAMSPLQIFLSLIAVLLAAISWVGLSFLADAHWSNTLLSNLVHTVPFRDGNRSKPGYMTHPPTVEIIGKGDGSAVAVSGRVVGPQTQPVAPVAPAIPTEYAMPMPMGYTIPMGYTMGNPYDGRGGYQYVAQTPYGYTQ
ncbi:hypothetical protein jhhlp_007759 [Lomentospora prolificans]|uniref:Uncharacterized protein n=1 Tax=Lomentospora prolificans TaxID=41688 RepID=A0A2N3N0H4_9PEZI|nr:hypothetical protein jhhlp_007759 [Lomentospora prolificans]